VLRISWSWCVNGLTHTFTIKLYHMCFAGLLLKEPAIYFLKWGLILYSYIHFAATKDDYCTNRERTWVSFTSKLHCPLLSVSSRNWNVELRTNQLNLDSCKLRIIVKAAEFSAFFTRDFSSPITKSMPSAILICTEHINLLSWAGPISFSTLQTSESKQ